MNVMTLITSLVSDGEPWGTLLDTVERAILRPYYGVFAYLEIETEEMAKRAGLVFDAYGLRQTIIDALAHPLYALVARVQLQEYHARGSSEEAVAGAVRFTFLYELRARTSPDEVEVLFRRYPVLEARIDGLVRQFHNHIGLLFGRLGKDFGSVNAMLCGNKALPIVTRVELLGDQHHDGSCVSRIEFKARDGDRVDVIYKPHSLQVDLAFVAFVNEVASHTHLRFKTPTYFAGDGYGWVEYIAQCPCQSLSEVRDYYHRLGWLLAIVYTLNGTDIHAGNVIACGPYPVIIDLECLLSPARAGQKPGMASASNLIMFTAMVPTMRMAVADRSGFDASAFSGQGSIEHSYRDWVLTDCDSNLPGIERRPKIVGRRQNIPILDGVEVDPFDYEQRFKAGFRRGYRSLLVNRASLLAENAAFARFDDVEIRVVLRNTSEYLKIIYESSHPRLLSSREDTESFYRSFTQGSFNLPVRDAELDALCNGLVPRFSTTSRTCVVRDMGGQDMQIVVERSGYECARTHLHDLSTEELLEQECLLTQALGAMRINRKKAPVDSASLIFAADVGDDGKQLVGMLLDILDRHDVGGRIPAWYSAELTRGGSCLVTRADWSLWKGNAGVMLAYFYALKQVEHLRAQQALDAGVGFLLSHADAKTLLSGRSGYRGVGGIVYLLSVLRSCARFGISDHHFGAYLDVQRSIASASNVPGVVGIAGDLLLLVESEQIGATSILREYLDELAKHAMTGAAFQTLMRRGNGRALASGDFWNGNLALLLAILRYARLTKNIELRMRCTEIAFEVVHACVAPSYPNALGLLALCMETEGQRHMREATLQRLARRLAETVDKRFLSHQYGFGSYQGVLMRLSSSGVVCRNELEQKSKEYLGNIMRHMRLSEKFRISKIFIPDISRGYAGVLLRVLQLGDIKAVPSPFIY
jgi:type 2 lantibiotic biosynthesis protein LanM